MLALLRFFLALFSLLFKSKSRLEAENAALRRQLIVLQRKVRGRVHFTNSDRLFLIQLYRWFPSVLKVITIILSLPKIISANNDCVVRRGLGLSLSRISSDWLGT